MDEPRRIYVRAHYRLVSTQFTPRWAVLCWDDGWWVATTRNQWTMDFDRAKLFLKRDAKKKFRNEIEAGIIQLVKVL